MRVKSSDLIQKKNPQISLTKKKNPQIFQAHDIDSQGIRADNENGAIKNLRS